MLRIVSCQTPFLLRNKDALMLWTFDALMLWTFSFHALMLASNTSSQIHTDWPSSLRNKGVYFVKRDKVSHLCHLCQSLSVFVKSFTIFVIVNQEPIPHLDEGLNNKEMNEELLNYLTCGDVHPNVLGFHCLCSCYPTRKLYFTEPSSC